MKPARHGRSGAKPPTALVGAGGLARAFLPGLVSAGYPVGALAARTLRSARRATRGFEGIRATGSALEAARGARLILLAVPDREIGPLARALARGLAGRLERCVVLHHAGSLGPEVLAPLAREGAAVGVLHPLQSLARGPRAAALLAGSFARIEGERRATTIARRLAHDLGMMPFSLPAGISRSDRLAYHAAASLVSNDLVALLSLAVRLLTRIGLSPAAALAALVPLARGTLLQIEGARSLPEALTGPVARADTATLAAQLRRLAGFSREASALHRLLSRELLDLARDSGMLDARQARSLREALRVPPGGRSLGPGV